MLIGVQRNRLFLQMHYTRLSESPPHKRRRIANSALPENSLLTSNIIRGKVRGAVLPQEYILAQFTRNMTFAEHTWKTENPACGWAGVQCQNGEDVSNIQWEGRSLRGVPEWRELTLPQLLYLELGTYFTGNQLSGNITWSWLPKSLLVFVVDNNEFTGSVETSCLPSALQTFSLNLNQFVGTVNFSGLPKSIVRAQFESNKFTGSVALEALPLNLQCLYADRNNFSGTVDLTRLPINTRSMYLSHNAFHGELDLTLLPLDLRFLTLQNNSFTGTVDFSHLPPDLISLNLEHNLLTSVSPNHIPQCVIM